MADLTPRERTTRRLEVVRATHRAISNVPHLTNLGPLEETTTESDELWSVHFRTAKGDLTVVEDEANTVLLLREEMVVAVEEPSERVLAEALVSAILGRSTIPPKSREDVRNTLAAARADADFRFREGMAHILTHRDHEAHWGTLDDAERWVAIEEAYIATRETAVKYLGFLPLLRSYGVPMQIMDIYDSEYNERAAELLATITPRKAHRR